MPSNTATVGQIMFLALRRGARLQQQSIVDPTRQV